MRQMFKKENLYQQAASMWIMLRTKILFCLLNLEKLVKEFLDLKDKCYKKVLRAQLNSYLQFLELQLEEESKDLVLFYNQGGVMDCIDH